MNNLFIELTISENYLDALLVSCLNFLRQIDITEGYYEWINVRPLITNTLMLYASVLDKSILSEITIHHACELMEMNAKFYAYEAYGNEH